MNWQEALEIAVIKRNCNRCRVLTSDSHPDHIYWRKQMFILAGIEVESEVDQITKTEHNPPNNHIQYNQYQHDNNQPQQQHPEQKTAISLGNGNIAAIPVSESIQITKEMNACPHFVRHSGCGCNRARCKIGKFGEYDRNLNDGTTLISFFDCAHCLRPDVELYEKNRYHPMVNAEYREVDEVEGK